MGSKNFPQILQGDPESKIQTLKVVFTGYCNNYLLQRMQERK